MTSGIQQNTICLSPPPTPFVLEKINGLQITQRETDIMACLLQGRVSKTIAPLLGIAESTVDTHIHNLMRRLGCNSRQSIREAIEKTPQALRLRQHYYFLLIQEDFLKHLKGVLALISKIKPACCLVYEQGNEMRARFIERLGEHLRIAGFKVHLVSSGDVRPLDPLIKENPLHSIPCILFCGGEGYRNILEQSQNLPELLIILDTAKEPPLPEILSEELQAGCGYYLGVFELLQRLLPAIKLEKLIEAFKEQYMTLKRAAESGGFSSLPIKKERQAEQELSRYTDFDLFKKGRLWVLGGSILCLCTIGRLLWLESFNLQSPPAVHADLFIPADGTLLDRPQLRAQIETKLKSQQGIRTLALIGIGGAGKTTLARQYAATQKASVVWEINAETRRSTLQSFERLAYALAKEEDEKKAVSAMQEISDPEERAERILFFVKDKLKAISKWFLIYDNVEDFSFFEKHFPSTVTAWGQGGVIVTTRDSTIKNNPHINDILSVKELTPKEQLELFVKVMNKGEEASLTRTQKEKAQQFLIEIPPFPLDTSIAAYYLKATNIPYTQYLERLRDHRKEFDNLQGSLLRSASTYDRTRYGIISLSLGQLINANKDFADLFVFLSLLDARDIPREVLDGYKDMLVVDDFIYNLKKFSFIENGAFPSFQPISSFSIHRSTQEISLAYLVRTLNLKKTHPLLDSVAKVLEAYVETVTDNEDLAKIKLLASHCETFLSHEDLLTERIIGSIGGDLGVIYYFLGDYSKSKDMLESALATLKDKKHDLSKVAYILAHAGNVYMLLNDYTKAETMMNHSLAIYRKHFPDNHAKIARVLSHLGNTYKATGQYEKALQLLKQSLLIYNTYLPHDHINMAWAYPYIGYTYESLGLYEKAKEAYEQSLHICKTYLPNNPVKVAWALANIGNIYIILGEYEKARGFIEESLLICDGYLPKDHRGVGWSQAFLGIVYRELGQYEKAREALTQSLSIFEKHLSKQQTLVSWILWNIGALESMCGNYKEAKSFLNQSLAALEKRYGKHHFKSAPVLRELGRLAFLENNLEKAEALLQEALNLYQQRHHPERYKVLECLAELQMKKSLLAHSKSNQQQSQYFKEEAINSLTQALEIVKAHFPEDSPHRARIQERLRELKGG